VKKRIRKKGNLSAQLKDSQINYSLKMERKARIENNTNIFVIKRMRQE
jgi:transposase